MKSAFGIEHGEIKKELGGVRKELGFMPMGPRKKANPAKMAALKAAYRTGSARQARNLARIGSKVVR